MRIAAGTALTALARRKPGVGAIAEYVTRAHRERTVLVDDRGPMTGAEMGAAIRAARPTGQPGLLIVPGHHDRTTVTAVLAAASGGWDVLVVDPKLGHRADLRPDPSASGRLWLGTTGTTGEPKHLARRHYDVGVLRPIRRLWRSWQLSAGASMLVEPVLHHGYGIGTTLLGLVAGGPVLVPADAEHRDELIVEYRPMLTVSVPLQLDRLPSVPGWLPRAMITGSGPLSPQVQHRATDRFGPVVHNLFGSTEAGFATMATPADLARAPGCVGRPLAGVGLRIDDGTGVIRVRSPFATAPGRWVETGDRGHLDHHRLLHLDGRTDLLTVSNGRNVAPDALAAVLRGHPAVVDVEFEASPDPLAGHRLTASVRVRESVTADDLHQWLRDRMGVGVTLDVRKSAADPGPHRPDRA